MRRTKAAETEVVVLRRRLNALEAQTSGPDNARAAVAEMERGAEAMFGSKGCLAFPPGSRVAIYDADGFVCDVALDLDGHPRERLELEPGQALVLHVSGLKA